MFGDVTVRHPEARVRHIQEDVHGFARAHEHRVLPHQIGLDDAVATEDEEPPRAVDVERVMHWVVGLHLVDEPDLDLIPHLEPPVDGGVLGPGFPVDDQPTHVLGRRFPDVVGRLARAEVVNARLPFL
jgi:hypothetical protein